MTREYAVELFNSEIKNFKRLDYSPKEAVQEYIDAMEMAIKALKQEPCSNCCNGNQIEKAKLCQKSYLAGMEHKKWIPISERLPEEREWYLAVFKETDTGYQLIPRVADYIGNGENVWRIIDEDGLGQEYCSILECVAWMPLPEPYKVKSEEDNAESEVEVCSSNFIQLKQDVLNNNQLWRKLREIEDEDSD